MLKTIQNIPLDPTPLHSLLSRASLEGTIDQCVLSISSGVASVNAVDMTNTVFACLSQKIELPDMEIGLCGLSNVIRVLAQGGECTLTLIEGEGGTAGGVVLKKKGLGTARFVLMNPSDVPTAVPEKGAGIKILSQCKAIFPLTREAVVKIDFFTGCFPSEVIRITGKTGSVTAASSESEANRFHTSVCSYKGADFATQIYCGMFMKALKSVFSDSSVKEVSILTGTAMPVIVQMNKGNFWAITPIAS